MNSEPLAGTGRAVASGERMSSRGSSVQEVALVTGASRGLGREIARQLLERGASVALIARSPEGLEQARRALEAGAPGRVAAWPCDVANAEEARRAVTATVARFGRLDLLVNNAGRIDVTPLDAVSRDDLERALGVHLFGPLALMRCALEGPFARQAGGRVINVAAIEGLVGAPRIGATAASKFALVGMSECARAEWARRGVRVTLVCPGFIRQTQTQAPSAEGVSAAPPAILRLARLPGLSIDVERAARRILRASDRDRARLVLTPAARALLLCHALAPQSLSRVAAWAERRLWRAAAGPGNTTPAT